MIAGDVAIYSVRWPIADASLLRAPAVRIPHQNRSLPSTKVVGATVSSSARCRSPNGYGSDGAITRVGDRSVTASNVVSGRTGPGEDVGNAELFKQRRP